MFSGNEEDLISQLPMEILAVIMSCLSLEEIKTLSEVSKLFQKVRHSEYLWRWLLRRDYGIQCEQLSIDGWGIMASEHAYRLVEVQNQELKNLQGLHSWHDLEIDKYEKFSDERDCLLKRENYLVKQNELKIELSMKEDQESIYLSCKISRLPKSILERWCQPNSNIHTLYLTSNHLSSLPLALFNLPKLLLLCLSDNPLREVPSHISKLTSLTSLDLGNNLLTRLPTELFTLTNLENLELGNHYFFINSPCHNKIDELPEQLGALTKLSRLGLGGLDLRVIPETFTNLQKLTFLYIEHNPRLTWTRETILELEKTKPNLQIVSKYYYKHYH